MPLLPISQLVDRDRLQVVGFCSWHPPRAGLGKDYANKGEKQGRNVPFSSTAALFVAWSLITRGSHVHEETKLVARQEKKETTPSVG